jgi:hypothetical protein
VEDGMTRYLIAAGLMGILAVAVAPSASAQHSAPAGSVSTGSAVPSGSSSSGSSSSGGTSSASSAPSSSGSSGGNSISDGSSGSGHRRGNTPASGTAVPRSNNPAGTITIGAGGFYPWGYVYGGGVGVYDGFYGGYYGAYDPWYGFSPVYAPYTSTSTSSSDDSGAIRLKVKPSDAGVYVDGYYAGVVDDFDGAFQRLHLQPGPHHIEFRATDYVPLSLDVMIQPDFTISYRGALIKR